MNSQTRFPQHETFNKTMGAVSAVTLPSIQQQQKVYFTERT